jgi:hypothetical protein
MEDEGVGKYVSQESGEGLNCKLWGGKETTDLPELDGPLEMSAVHEM